MFTPTFLLFLTHTGLIFYLIFLHSKSNKHTRQIEYWSVYTLYALISDCTPPVFFVGLISELIRHLCGKGLQLNTLTSMIYIYPSHSYILWTWSHTSVFSISFTASGSPIFFISTLRIITQVLKEDSCYIFNPTRWYFYGWTYCTLLKLQPLLLTQISPFSFAFQFDTVWTLSSIYNSDTLV